MDRRERMLCLWHGFDIDWWIFSVSVSWSSLRRIHNPKWLGLFLCKFNKHDWFANEFLTKTSLGIKNYKCQKCGKIKPALRLIK